MLNKEFNLEIWLFQRLVKKLTKFIIKYTIFYFHEIDLFSKKLNRRCMIKLHLYMYFRFQKENEENNNSSEFDVCLPGSTSGIQNPFMVCATPSS